MMRENRSISGVSNIWHVTGLVAAPRLEELAGRAAITDEGAGAVADITSLAIAHPRGRDQGAA
ncbi:MAG: hypothetical protein ABI134_02565 [Byssovorax sp.]